MGNKITEDARSTRETVNRINQAKRAFKSNKHNTFTSRNMSIQICDLRFDLIPIFMKCTVHSKISMFTVAMHLSKYII